MGKVCKLSLTLLAIICSFLFMQGNTINTYADDSITLTINTSNISLNLTTTSSTGKFAESTPANISVSTTSSSGYTLSIASPTGSTDLTNTTDNTSKITSIDSSFTNSDFSNSSNTQYNNKWGYKPSQYVTTDGDTHTTHTNTGANAVFKPLPGQAGEILAITEQANQQNSPDTYTISMGARVNNTIPTGSYQSNAFVIMAVANTTVVQCDDTKLCVQFDGNGLTFPETEAQTERVVNNVNYNSGTTQGQVTKYSHTPNISDAGVQDGNYANSYTQNEVVTIDGASTLHIKLTYGGESASYDWVSFWAGDYPSYTAASDYSTGIQNCGGGTVTNGKYGGTNGTTVECDITGPSVTFAFKSDGSGVGNGYGYYAVVTGTGTVLDRTLTSGEYATPTGTNAIFNGWSSTATTPGAGLPSSVEYADESAVKSNMPGDNTETKTLYAVWQQEYPITFTMDSNTSSIAIVDANGTTVDTITASGQTTILAQGDTYTLKPTHAISYTTDTITKTTGAGTLSGKNFTVGAGSATISVSSKQMLPMQNYSCSNLANVGDTDMVYDTRDNQAYLIGKLKDNKCWMLENLNIAGGTALSADNTDVTSAYISSFSTSNNLTKSGSAIVLPASSTSGFSTNNYSNVYNSGNKTNCGASGQNTPCYSYYSWDAATLGSGRSISTDNTDAPYSICPKGWKLPSTYNGSGTAAEATDFRALMIGYGGSNSVQTYNSSTTPTGATMYGNIGPGTTPNFLLAGFYYVSSFNNGGSDGGYWSSTSYSNTDYARNLVFSSSYVYSAGSSTRSGGYSVRCLLAE